MILVVTGLGGSLSAILKGTPAVSTIAEFFQSSGVPAILFPFVFVLGVAGNMITGSSTVGVITAASLTAPMLETLAPSPEAAMLSGGYGSVILKYVNSSYFWVCTSLTKLAVSDAILSYGGATMIGGVVSFVAVCVMWSIGLI
jgi:GntP family gluconate:H+ symporter